MPFTTPLVAKRKQEPGHISGDAKLDFALNQLTQVLAEIAATPEVPESDEPSEKPVGNDDGPEDEEVDE
jgi:hypothetical protein